MVVEVVLIAEISVVETVTVVVGIVVEIAVEGINKEN
jgi:hypothetical protein